MKKFLFTILVFFILTGIATTGGVFAQDFPAKPDLPKETQSAIGQSPPNQPFFGYVPPPPIRHTWPGGYKVIFHELLNTLSEHMLGWY